MSPHERRFDAALRRSLSTVERAIRNCRPERWEEDAAGVIEQLRREITKLSSLRPPNDDWAHIRETQLSYFAFQLAVFEGSAPATEENGNEAVARREALLREWSEVIDKRLRSFDTSGG